MTVYKHIYSVLHCFTCCTASITFSFNFELLDKTSFLANFSNVLGKNQATGNFLSSFPNAKLFAIMLQFERNLSFAQIRYLFTTFRGVVIRKPSTYSNLRKSVADYWDLHIFNFWNTFDLFKLFFRTYPVSVNDRGSEAS